MVKLFCLTVYSTTHDKKKKLIVKNLCVSCVPFDQERHSSRVCMTCHLISYSPSISLPIVDVSWQTMEPALYKDDVIWRKCKTCYNLKKGMTQKLMVDHLRVGDQISHF